MRVVFSAMVDSCLVDVVCSVMVRSVMVRSVMADVHNGVTSSVAAIPPVAVHPAPDGVVTILANGGNGCVGVVTISGGGSD